jgi:hypothetical protein
VTDKRHYFILWNADRSEGFITDSSADAASAVSGEPHWDEGYPSQSSMGEAFYNFYGEDGVLVEEIDL